MFTSFNARAIGFDLNAKTTLELARGAGFDGVDLMVRDIVDSETDLPSLRRQIKDLGLKPGAWPLPMDWKRDAESFERDLQRLPTYAKAASILGLERTGTWVLPEVPPSTPLEVTADMHRFRLGSIAKVLEDFGIRLGLEVIGVESSRTQGGLPFVYRLADLDRYFQPLFKDHPNIGILLDGFHRHAAGDSIEAGLAWGIDKVVWVHVADLPIGANPDRTKILDPVRGLPGDTPFVETAELLKHLSDAGYDGPVTPEPLAKCRTLTGKSPSEAANLVITALKHVWPTSASTL